MTRPPRDIQASVHQRLLNLSKHSGRAFNDLVMYYAIERFLYRLAQSQHARHVVLKGGLLLRAWDMPVTRVTRDIDLLGKLSNDPDHIRDIVRQVCGVAVEDDGLAFDAQSVATARISEDADYEGVRANFRGQLGKMPLAMQIDFGFGDIITPQPEPITYPSLLSHPPAQLMAYNRETVIAEKFEAMVKLGELNSRMKDFFDVYTLATSFTFDGQTLAEAIATTFKHRGTAVENQPACFGEHFVGNAAKNQQWKGFLKTHRVDQATEEFADTVAVVAGFLVPPASAITTGRPFALHWGAGGPWKKD